MTVNAFRKLCTPSYNDERLQTAVEYNIQSFKHLHVSGCAKRSTLKYVTHYVIASYIPRACPVLKKVYHKTVTFMVSVSRLP